MFAFKLLTYLTCAYLKTQNVLFDILFLCEDKDIVRL